MRKSTSNSSNSRGGANQSRSTSNRGDVQVDTVRTATPNGYQQITRRVSSDGTSQTFTSSYSYSTGTTPMTPSVVQHSPSPTVAGHYQRQGSFLDNGQGVGGFTSDWSHPAFSNFNSPSQQLVSRSGQRRQYDPAHYDDIEDPELKRINQPEEDEFEENEEEEEDQDGNIDELTLDDIQRYEEQQLMEAIKLSKQLNSSTNSASSSSSNAAYYEDEEDIELQRAINESMKQSLPVAKPPSQQTSQRQQHSSSSSSSPGRHHHSSSSSLSTGRQNYNRVVSASKPPRPIRKNASSPSPSSPSPSTSTSSPKSSSAVKKRVNVRQDLNEYFDETDPHARNELTSSTDEDEEQMYNDPDLRGYLSQTEQRRIQNEQNRREMNRQYDESRRIREEQEKEFNDSLRKDQQKQEDEEMAIAMKLSMEANAQALLNTKRSKLAVDPSTLPPDQIKGREREICEISVCLPPDGKRITRKFFVNANLQAVREWIEVYVYDEGDSRQLQENYQLVTTFPKEVLSDTSKTLFELNLYPRSILNLSNP